MTSVVTDWLAAILNPFRRCAREQVERFGAADEAESGGKL